MIKLREYQLLVLKRSLSAHQRKFTDCLDVELRSVVQLQPL
ncbi:unnamed protein product [Meloidogyne enterolobii]|uniref:Uncharacterized protein n=1 Tax=Meloidogyne enterolobii TaxID=390850 RepID=A0ACB0ZN21_MELEN